ncbi:hypothetical protein BDY19DRAFT_998366 [Irpex rosettiformis]|uniref:Uncharacterized protein n=1 Tax=Irpex rosettiformis TaxID=378272 RepID=A0ACB8TNR5_9APHY|nr:hypothetical protein BDY19DRAFT_998366 [Irpex rosettiformis]
MFGTSSLAATAASTTVSVLNHLSNKGRAVTDACSTHMYSSRSKTILASTSLKSTAQSTKTARSSKPGNKPETSTSFVTTLPNSPTLLSKKSPTTAPSQLRQLTNDDVLLEATQPKPGKEHNPTGTVLSLDESNFDKIV